MKPLLEEKTLLNAQETIALFDLSPRKFHALLSSNKLPFVVHYRKRRLIIRTEFEVFLAEHPDEKERLKNARR